MTKFNNVKPQLFFHQHKIDLWIQYLPLFIYINNFEVDKHSANVTVFPTFLPGVSMGIFYNHLRSILIANLKQQSRIPEDQQLVFTLSRL